MSKRLTEKVAVVTGGGSGIGEAICLRFASEGARVAVLDLDGNAAEKVAAAIGESGGEARPYQCDVSNMASVEEMLAQAAKDFGGLTTLVNNAGIAHIGNVEQTSPEDLDKLYQVNVKGVYHCLQVSIPYLKSSGGGSIVNMGSIASTVGIPDRFAYSMSKGAVLMMSRSVACDYLDDNIRCNCISPARVHTPFVDKFLADNYPGNEAEMLANLSATQPLGRMGQPEEIASLAVYLASDEATFVTGANFEIDGGFHNLKP
ncbi:MAG: SDR family oxidoreductase [Lacipirellulaceae bacterium]